MNPPIHITGLSQGKSWILIHVDTRVPAFQGQELTDFRRDSCRLLSGTPPMAPGKTGYVELLYDGGHVSSSYPSVVGLVWTESSMILAPLPAGVPDTPEIRKALQDYCERKTP